MLKFSYLWNFSRYHFSILNFILFLQVNLLIVFILSYLLAKYAFMDVMILVNLFFEKPTINFHYPILVLFILINPFIILMIHFSIQSILNIQAEGRSIFPKRTVLEKKKNKIKKSILKIFVLFCGFYWQYRDRRPLDLQLLGFCQIISFSCGQFY